MDFAEALAAARQTAQVEDAKFKAVQEQQEAALLYALELADRRMLPALTRATVHAYTEWLRGFVAQGGAITHVYPYPFSQWRFFRAKRSFEIVPLFGAHAVNIIIPKGITVRGANYGHNNLFWLDGFKYAGLVPLFSDIGGTNEVA